VGEEKNGEGEGEGRFREIFFELRGERGNIVVFPRRSLIYSHLKTGGEIEMLPPVTGDI